MTPAHLVSTARLASPSPDNAFSRRTTRQLRILYVVEGFTDIRFVVGLASICNLTMLAPAESYRSSGLKQRVAESGVPVNVGEIPGGRLGFQARAFGYLWKAAKTFDCILAQETLRGALDANIVGWLRGVPVITYLATSPVEYFHCRRERKQIGWATATAGELLIRALMVINGRFATRCIAMGPYLRQIAAHVSPRVATGLYYGIDTELFRPADRRERVELRRKYDLPVDRFLIVLSSRISHEKDPETVLHAVAMARARGLDAVILNLSGGYRDFLALAHDLGFAKTETWVLGRPAVHPMRELSDYFRAADALALASLAEGCGISPLEALACGTPVVATAVGGLAATLDGLARLTPRRDAAAMAAEILWIANHQDRARTDALRARSHIQREWSRERAFLELSDVIEEVCLECSKRQKAADRASHPSAVEPI